MFSKKNNNKKKPQPEKAKSMKKKEAPIDLRTTGKAKSWVASLPLTDMGETTKRLFIGLTTLNHESVSPQTRIEVTEVILPYIKMVLENLDRHFLSRSFPLP
ncbi:MAG TPA: hypothetical protein EYH38_05145, partial [Leucothrix sp.]|nr:hypothetical protein [Leucothrix sp.]